MKRYAPTSMRARMTLWLALIFAFFMAFLSAGYLFYARAQMERNYAASLDQIAPEGVRLAGRGASLEELGAAIGDHNERVAQSGAVSEGVEAWLLDANGRPVWHFGPPRSHRGSGHRRDKSSLGLAPRLIPPLDNPNTWRTRELKWQGQKLVLALPLRRAQGELRGQAFALVALSLLVTGAAGTGGWALVGKTLRPISALALQARESAKSPVQLLEQRAPLRPTSRDEEMTNLVGTLNEMISNVREAALSKERFHTSASHELRTPLQALSGHLGVALSRERSATEYQSALEEAARQTTRLGKLTGDLLLLNRLQTAASAPARERVDVTEMCDIALQRAQKTIEARGLKVVDNLEALEVEAPSSHVEILLGNLVENAAKYARIGSEIGVTISSSTRSVEVWNEIHPEQAPALKSDSARLFDPFYRPDQSRTSETGGNGLGLAICQTIAVASGWPLEIEVEQNHFRVCVVLRAQQEESHKTAA